MATSTVKMNGSWGRMALALVLSALLVHNCVVCDENTTAAVPTTTIIAKVATTELSSPTDHEDSSTPGAVATTAEAEQTSDAAPAGTAGQASTSVTAEPTTPSTTQRPTTERTTAPETDTTPAATTLEIKAAWTTTLMTSNPATDMVSSVATEVPVDTQTPAQTPAQTLESTTVSPTVLVTNTTVMSRAPPVIQCVGKEAVRNRGAVQLQLVVPSSCEETKRKLERHCEDNCKLYVFQEDNSNIAIVTGSDTEVDVTALANRFNRGVLKHQLGLVEATPVYEEHPPTVLVTLLICGLLLATLLIGGYYLRERRNRRAKGMRLAEESYQADEENQGNTLVSVAPLHPPAPQEKPSINGESAKAAKIEPPPAATNGHSAAKAPVADTEL
ncbi:hypothetical protein GJAV_G00185360 [Gymnothorax javanicus]|nr:hypothetical protein GJAV_G00185360 [Gymnothorax javanicus]